MRIAIGVEYDGSRFCGWQTQPDGCGVQNALEGALGEIAGHTVSTVCAGRTDAGVHALGQVVHFDTASHRPLTAWVRGTNALLPPAVAVTWAQCVAPEFHARYSAISRTYRYLLLNRPVRPAAAHGRIGWFHMPLDVPRMRAAAGALVGCHDFSAFRSAECQARSPIRTMMALTVERQGDCIVMEFRANAFLHHMVRNIVGTLVAVGKGREEPEWVAELLASRDRRRAAATFEAAGLHLVNVEYDARWALPPAPPRQRDAEPAALQEKPRVRDDTRACASRGSIGVVPAGSGSIMDGHDVRSRQMTTAVKICGITRLQDALAAVRAGAHAIGFVFHAPSPRCIAPDAADAILRALPPFITTVGLFVNADPREVHAVLDIAPVQLLQFHGEESPEYCRQFSRPYMKAVRMGPEVDLLEYARRYHDAKALLLDAYVEGVHGGTGVSFDWARVPANLPLPIVVSGGLDAENVRDAVRQLRPCAVDVSSGVESAKGIKDAARIAAFIAGVRNADV